MTGYLGNTKQRFKQQFSLSRLKTDIDTFAYSLNYNTSQFENMKRANDAKRLSANYQLDINFDREGSLTQAISLLANYEKSNYDANNYIDEKKLIEKSAALEYRLFSENDHSLSIGGRYIDNSQYENAWTGRIAGAYRLSQNFRTHASFGKAIQNPTFIEYFGYFGNFIGNPNLKPEKVLVAILVYSLNPQIKNTAWILLILHGMSKISFQQMPLGHKPLILMGKPKLKAWKWLITVN